MVSRYLTFIIINAIVNSIVVADKKKLSRPTSEGPSVCTINCHRLEQHRKLNAAD